jgi:choline dehydrogenase-like flavoprotein
MLRAGRRMSAADAYLRPLRRNPNLTLLLRARALRLQMDGDRCIGVFVRHDGRELQVRARAELIVAAGTFGSPKLLMQSGIGAPGLLAAAGIPLRHALPGVGANLVAQVAVPVVGHVTLPTLRAVDRGAGAALAAARWLATHGGAWSSPLVVAECSLRSDAALAEPDLHVRLLAAAVRADEAGRPRLVAERGVSALVGMRHPRARGRVCVTSADPDAPLRVEHLALMDADEVQKLVAGVRWVRRAYAGAQLGPLIAGELAPGAELDGDGELADYVRRASVTQSNAVGTCRLGAGGDLDSVVDPELRVRGLRGLRVADASVLPFAPGAHPAAAAMMIGERVAEIVAAGERG